MSGKILISNEDVLALIGLIYKAPGDIRLWETFLSQLASACKAAFGTLDYYNTSQKSGDIAVSLNIDPEFCDEYACNYADKNAWINNHPRHIPLGTPIIGQMVVPDTEFVRTEFYQDFLRRRDIFHLLGGSIADRSPTTALLSLFRPRSAEPFGVSDLSLFKLLVPHLRQALKLHRQITMAQASQQSLVEALDRMPIGTIIVNILCQVLMMNKIAREIVAAKDGLTIDASCLKAMAMKETTQLRTLVACAAVTSRGAAVHPGGSMQVSRPSLRRSLKIQVIPTTSSELSRDMSRAAAVIFVSDPESSPGVSQLSNLYGLTRAESRFATLLVQGTTVGEAAEALQISQNTARTHLKNIFLKTDVRRQSGAHAAPSCRSDSAQGLLTSQEFLWLPLQKEQFLYPPVRCCHHPNG